MLRTCIIDLKEFKWLGQFTYLFTLFYFFKLISTLEHVLPWVWYATLYMSNLLIYYFKNKQTSHKRSQNTHDKQQPPCSSGYEYSWIQTRKWDSSSDIGSLIMSLKCKASWEIMRLIVSHWKFRENIVKHSAQNETRLNVNTGNLVY